MNADHYQFYLEDPTVAHTTARLCSTAAHADRVDVLPGLIAVGTSRYGGDVPVTIEITATPPPEENFDAWDHVVECTLEVRGHHVILTSPDSFGPGSPHVPISPGTYRARVYYGDLDQVDDEDDLLGDDHYKIVLWPYAVVAPRVLKRKPLP